jgi:DNA polymerase-1
MKNKWVGFDKDEEGKYIEDNDKLILAYLLLKRTEQSITTFGKDWLKYLHPITGRIHSNYRQILNTSRMSSTNPNLQNLPGGEYRDCFISSKGKKMLNADYSAQEIRIVADITQDEAFVDFFISGDDTFLDDFHSYTATKMYRIMNNDPELFVPPKELAGGVHNKDFTDEHGKMRNNAKAINFKINYGGSAYTLKDDFGVEEEVAQKFIDTYLDAFPTLREDFKRTKKDAINKGYVLIDDYSDRRWFCPFHKEMQDLNDKIREYYPEGYFEGAYKGEAKEAVKQEIKETYPFVSDMWRQYFRMHGKLERAGLNYRVQGKAAMLMKFSMNYLRHKLITEKLDDFILTNLVHDESLAESPEDKAPKYGQLLSEAMVKGGEYFCKTVPMKATCIPADTWTH